MTTSRMLSTASRMDARAISTGMRASAAEHRHADLAAEGGELIGGGGTIDVARGEKRAFALFLEHIGELDGCGGLAGTLQAHEHDHIGNAA